MKSVKRQRRATPMRRGNRRSFLKHAALGGMSLGCVDRTSVESQVARATENIRRYSSPTELRITDLRMAQVGKVPIVKIDTNQGIFGLGDVRDSADKRYALLLKSRILGENPCNVERLFKRVKQFGSHGRQGGGVSAVEMALWDIVGKAYEIPLYQLLGGKYRNKVRIYADTPSSSEPARYARIMKERVATGYTFLKMDLGIGLLDQVPGALTGANFWGEELHGWEPQGESYAQTEHPFTRVQITEKGIEILLQYVAAVREAIGMEVPLGIDHLEHMGINSCLRLGEALTPFNIAWLEDIVPWENTEQWREATRTLQVPTMTGEDIYSLDGFRPLIERRAVDMVHPDLTSAGGLLETKRIGDHAQRHGIAMAMHHAGSPISFMAAVHVAAATESFVALEHHSVDNPWWEDLITGVEKPLVQEGFVAVPESPGIGVRLNEHVVKQHLREGEGYFEPTPEWNEQESWDRTWS